MKIEITCTPKFWLYLTLAQVELLSKLAIWHYDATCNRAALQGGFIFGWLNHYKFVEEHDEGHGPVSASFGDLDLALKIMEMPPKSIPDQKEALAMIGEMSINFRRALSLSNAVCSDLKFNV